MRYIDKGKTMKAKLKIKYDGQDFYTHFSYTDEESKEDAFDLYFADIMSKTYLRVLNERSQPSFLPNEVLKLSTFSILNKTPPKLVEIK